MIYLNIEFMEVIGNYQLRMMGWAPVVILERSLSKFSNDCLKAQGHT